MRKSNINRKKKIIREKERRKFALEWPWKYWFHTQSYGEIKKSTHFLTGQWNYHYVKPQLFWFCCLHTLSDSSYCFLAPSSTILSPACQLSISLLSDILHTNIIQSLEISVSLQQDHIGKVMLHKSRSPPFLTFIHARHCINIYI